MQVISCVIGVNLERGWAAMVHIRALKPLPQ